MMTSNDAISKEFAKLIQDAYDITEDIGKEVEEVLSVGMENPLPHEDAVRMINVLIEKLRHGAEGRGDGTTVQKLTGDFSSYVEELVNARQRISRQGLEQGVVRVHLVAWNGIEPKAVKPTPTFHMRPVPVLEGFVRTRDVVLWDANERLDIHLAQFQRVHGRKPTPDEVMDIMLSRMNLPGLFSEDQFKICDLARSIAVNGVRVPPIIDVDGKLLDGNRRIAACYFILSSDEFSPEEKKRAETIIVWQLTEHATDDDREAVVVSLNFEPNYKLNWPEYVKAQKVYNEWESMLSLEPTATHQRQQQMKRELSKKFALGADTSTVSRYLKMVDLAIEFEDFHTTVRKNDPYEVKHVSADRFQYFDELNKGKNPGGVNYALNQDEPFKNLVFDLLYDGKFSNWNKIRPLKYIPDNQEALQHLYRARDEKDIDRAQDLVDQAIGIAHARRVEQRILGVNTRIETFVSFLEDLPVRVFNGEGADSITRENLMKLHKALKLVESYLPPIAETGE